jgi:hypothetical protein
LEPAKIIHGLIKKKKNIHLLPPYKPRRLVEPKARSKDRVRLRVFAI